MSYLQHLLNKDTPDNLDERLTKLLRSPYSCQHDLNTINDNLDHFTSEMDLWSYWVAMQEIFDSLKFKPQVDLKFLICETLFNRFNSIIEKYTDIKDNIISFNTSLTQLLVAFILQNHDKAELCKYINDNKSILYKKMGNIIFEFDQYFDMFAEDGNGSPLFGFPPSGGETSLYNKISDIYDDVSRYINKDVVTYEELIGTAIDEEINLNIDSIILGGERYKEKIENSEDIEESFYFSTGTD